jgi:hypothetical protein
MVRIKLFALILLLITACAEQVPQELNQAAKVIKFMMKPSNLSRSSFSVLFDQHKPSEFVSYIFSEMGASEWPMGGGLDDPEQLQSIGAPVPPTDVSFASRKPDLENMKQIVVGFDDAKGVVTIAAYLDPTKPSVFEREWIFPTTIKSAPGIDEMTQSVLQMGVSYESF